MLPPDLTQPLQLDRKFDLAVSLEVAEHLPASAGETLIATLARLAPAVLFSAAIPQQSGRHHINEQWPDYWAELFSKHDFTPCDVLRTQFWSDARVEWWYAQNIVLYVKPELLERIPGARVKEKSVLSLVHPANYQRHVWRERVLTACVDLAAAVPPQSRLILADEDRFGDVYLPDRTVVPYTERNGAYAGPPADDHAALRELDRQIDLGAAHFAIGWPAFWHFDHYQRLAQRLLEGHRQVLSNDNVMLFEL